MSVPRSYKLDADTEAAILRQMLTDPSLLPRLAPHLRPEGFEAVEAKRLARAALDHYRDRGAVPSRLAVLADLGEVVNVGKMTKAELAACAKWLQQAMERPTITTEHAADLILGREREDALFEAVAEAGKLLASGKVDDVAKVVTAADAVGRGNTTGGVHAEVVPLGTISTVPLRHLWFGRIAQGKPVFLEGDPGVGKTFVLCDLVARLTTGRALHVPPQEAPIPVAPTTVLMVAVEDDPADTLRPRLEAAGADVSRVHLLTAVVAEDGTRRPVRIPDDVPAIERLLREKQIGMVTIDPLSAVLAARTDTNTDAAVRQAVDPLVEMTTRLGATLVMVRHFSKKTDQQAVHRGGGSVAFAAAVRAVLHVLPDPDNPDRRLLLAVKYNNGRKGRTLSFEIQGGEETTPCIEWRTDAPNITADEAHARNEQRRRERQAPKKVEAVEFLRNLLQRGPVPAKEIYDAADAAGIARPTLQKAKKEIGVIVEKQKGRVDGEWSWSLTTTAEPGSGL